MFSSDRNKLRQSFFTAWEKQQKKLPLEPLEAQLVDIILLHPEYQVYLENPEQYQDFDFAEHNPFLHLSLHIAIREQVTTDRPAGIKIIYDSLCRRLGDKHVAEHAMLECLGQFLWDAQQSGKMPEEKDYLVLLRKL